MEMPKYKCHKEVWALQIGRLEQSWDTGRWSFIPKDPRYARVPLEDDYVEKHKPYDGGYYVLYADGYRSFSPADVFESGYTPIN